jgi:hypothetical protein
MTRKRVLAVATLILAALLGLATNLVTDSPGWLSGGIFLVLLIAACAVAWRGYNGSHARTHVSQVALGTGSRIEESAISAKGASDVTEEASSGGKISNTKTTADGADVHRKAEGGTIDGGTIEAKD